MVAGGLIKNGHERDSMVSAGCDHVQVWGRSRAVIWKLGGPTHRAKQHGKHDHEQERHLVLMTSPSH